jgi:RNA polymerase-binding transcription factor DksA
VLTEIADVRHAYERLLRGTYGECEACGDPIPDERLRALPAARYCVLDEQRREGLAPA